MTDDPIELAAEAFIYGYPFVYNLEEVDRFTKEGVGGLSAAPFNAFAHADALADPSATFVSINNDTVYSIAQVDVGSGPVRLDVPDSAGRYYVLQFVDAWTDNFAYVGARATGTEAGSFLLVASDWSGGPEESDGATVIRFPTRVASIVGRWAVAGEDDLPAVGELQAALTLSPSGDGPAGLPRPAEGVAEEIAWFEKLRTWMHAFPPAVRERDMVERFRPLGLLDRESPYVSPGDDLAQALRSGLAAGRDRMEAALREAEAPRQNRWSLAYHAFDYNLDFFEIGALDDDRWKLPDTEGRYLMRALSARGGLWGNHGYEAAYAMVYEDADGNQLDGANRYVLTFPTEPPCGAFWSVTMYDTPDFYLVENPIGRYSVGDRTAGLKRGADGSLTICMQRDEPTDPEAAANWLPTPAGPFRPLLRVYKPGDEIFDGRYELPPIRRLSVGR